ncbi:hypothetical protein [Streptomonospora litoralis]|uniref:Uncharacterized protein n=1 Tax=Streptomonospora litoralis TaxID=2498135 RepID=A0A4P6PZI3_9ACTN|nr:hypothetical protein [Streptomonospora litoralis]QBI51929.1 hypothetical protein EKD16_00540 [Streptomonospora litoralis]
MTLERGNSLMPVHAATLMWPTGIATGAGLVAGGLSFLVSLPTIAIAGPIGTAIFWFALVGGGVAVLGGKGDRRARRWAGQYPWRFASGPAALAGLGIAVVSLFGSGFFGAIFTGLASAAVIWVILGIIGMVAGNKSA